ADKEGRNADVGLCVVRDVGRHVQSGTSEAVCLSWNADENATTCGGEACVSPSIGVYRERLVLSDATG
ncbi:hypothetical protein L917_08796, partial [Phytophthora nicotianae]